LPGFEQFLRVYDTLPYVYHELAHHKHRNIIPTTDPRKNRNETLAYMSFVSVSEAVLRQLCNSLALSYPRFRRTKTFFSVKEKLANTLFIHFIESKDIGDLSDILFLPMQYVIKSYIKNTLGIDIREIDRHISREDGITIFVQTIGKYSDVAESEKLSLFKKEASLFDLKHDTSLIIASAYCLYDDTLASYKQVFQPEKTYKATWIRAEKELREAFYAFLDSLISPPSSLETGFSVTFPRHEFNDMLAKELLAILEAELSARVRPSNTAHDLKSYNTENVLKVLSQAIRNRKKEVVNYWTLSNEDIDAIVLNEWETYNEFAADLSMSLSLRFDTAGYLYFFSSGIVGVLSEPIIDTRINRAQMVVEALNTTVRDSKGRVLIAGDQIKQLLETKVQDITFRLRTALLSLGVQSEMIAVQESADNFVRRVLANVNLGYKLQERIPRLPFHKSDRQGWNMLEREFSLVEKYFRDDFDAVNTSIFAEIAVDFFKIVFFVEVVRSINEKHALTSRVSEHVKSLQTQYGVYIDIDSIGATPSAALDVGEDVITVLKKGEPLP
jgi:hypothetical protein